MSVVETEAMAVVPILHTRPVLAGEAPPAMPATVGPAVITTKAPPRQQELAESPVVAVAPVAIRRVETTEAVHRAAELVFMGKGSPATPVRVARPVLRHWAAKAARTARMGRPPAPMAVAEG